MAQLVYPINPDSLLADVDAARSMARNYAEAYQSASPYPHICIDNFLPEQVLENVLADLRNRPEKETTFARAQENKKVSYVPERLPAYTKNLFYALNSRPFILFLEEMTGIEGLIPDPFFFGAGVHETANGGHLDIHADFNLHSKMKVERRLNTLIYLNKDWREEWGGSFEIWDKEMKGKVHSFTPLFNRMVTFSTTSDSFHGNPSVVNHPEDKTRDSIALYYYTATWDESRKSHSTLFKPRPNSADKKDYAEIRRDVLREFTPPMLYRRIIGPLSRLGF
ncbi:2OG-Fe(II) oxygenase [Neorhizobium galegae]|uniref:Proline hydroxylase-like protein n=1 Tax=Neorhizobium galegae bv. officinalis TaxID=323656 RepID=A0A0T7GBZ0_NEOGA|nr:2OG-Fe(II) oxygenase [Neorhizobium galegae]CDZ44772.1 Proline hydroxylase-like protein [Neorhizobium galegae bv. officinalis]